MILELILRQALHLRGVQREDPNRDLRLVEERQLLAALGAVALCAAPGMGGDRLAFLDGRLGHRKRLAQVQLVRIGFGGKAFALLPKDLTAEPLELVLEGGDLLVLHRIVCAWERARAASSAALIEGDSVRVDEPEDAALCMSLIVARGVRESTCFIGSR